MTAPTTGGGIGKWIVAALIAIVIAAGAAYYLVADTRYNAPNAPYAPPPASAAPATGAPAPGGGGGGAPATGAPAPPRYP